FVCHTCNTSSALLLRRFLLASHGPFRTTTSTRVRTRALTAHRQVAAMAHTTIAANLDQPLDIHIHFAAQITFDSMFAINHLAQAVDFFFSQVLHPRIRADTCPLQDFAACCQANPEDIAQRYFHAFLARNVNAGNSSHLSLQLQDPLLRHSHPGSRTCYLTLLLLMLWIFA